MRLATLEQADAWRVSLLRTVSHDLLTPLAAIEAALSTLEVYGERLRPADRAELVATALSRCRRSSTLVVDLLDVSRIEAGVRALERVEVDLVELALEVAGEVDAKEEATAVRIVADGPVRASVDPSLMREVLWNLFDNAVRHGPIGDDIEVLVRAEGERATVAVRDHGRLARPGEARALLDWFHTAGPTGRTGLGLAIVRSFLEAHGGELTVEVEPSATVFRCSIPRCLPVAS